MVDYKMLANPKNRVVVMEPHTGGHHGSYAAWMIKGLAEKGGQVTLATLEESLDHASLKEILSYRKNSSGGSINIVTPSSKLLKKSIGGHSINMLASQFNYWSLFRNWYHQLSVTEKPDVVFLPYMDYCFYAMGLLGSPFRKCPWVGLPMLPTFHHREMGINAPLSSIDFLKKIIFLRIIRNQYLRLFFVIDESLFIYLKERKIGIGKVELLPEPAEFGVLPKKTVAKEKLGIEQRKKILLVFGTITQRKGVKEIIQAAENFAWPKHVCVLFAGKVFADTAQILNSAEVSKLISEGRLKIYDSYIEKNEVATLFAAADMVWLGYKHHYKPSSVLVNACKARIPVIACNEGVIGWQTKRYGLGEVVQISSVDSIINAINSICKSKRLQVNDDEIDFDQSPIDLLSKALL